MRINILAAAAAVFALAWPAAAQPVAPAPALVAAPPTPQMTAADVGAWLDGLMPNAIEKGDIAGGVVVVVKDGQILVKKGYGFADVAKKIPVDPDKTLFRPGSISKLFAWTSIMQLVEQGKVDLDADVNRYLDFRIPPRDGKPITLRNIMTHSPGFEERMRWIMNDKPTPALGAYLKEWIPDRVFAPGEVPAYSNYATAIAGYIVQRVSGEKSYEDYAERHILQPLGMTQSSLHQPLPARLQPFMSKGYKLGSGPEQYYEYVGPAPAGSLAASGADMGRFMIAHLQRGTYNGATILQPATADMMHAAQPKIFPALDGMALGFYETGRNGRRVISHNGGTQFFHSDLHLFLDDGVGIFISLNTPGAGGGAGAIHAALFEGFADRYLPRITPLPASTVDAATAKTHAAEVAGVYEGTRGASSNFVKVLTLLQPLTVVGNTDGTISIQGSPQRFEEIAPYVWREVGGQKKLAVKMANGRPVLLGMDGLPPVPFRPSPAWRSPGWMLPAVIVSLLALLATGLTWPAAALARRRYGAPFALEGKPALTYRAVRVLGLAAVALFVAFPMVALNMLMNMKLLSTATDGLVLTLQVLSLVVFAAGAVFGVWNAVLVWTNRRGWFGKLWSTVVAASFLLLLYAALAYRLIGFTTQY